MVARGGGVIVNQTSMAAYMETGAYSVTKLALVGITNVLAAELGGDNIRVNAIGPGVMTGKIPPDLLQTTLALQKLRPQGNPDDLVGALLFLCSDRSSFVTGQTILVDGGAIRGASRRRVAPRWPRGQVISMSFQSMFVQRRWYSGPYHGALTCRRPYSLT
jgi:NAD(P)-dependent dehydrogenase (short-subunit alcohol dehydrogenase family)